MKVLLFLGKMGIGGLVAIGLMQFLPPMLVIGVATVLVLIGIYAKVIS